MPLQSAPYASTSPRTLRTPYRALNALSSTQMCASSALDPARLLAQSPSTCYDTGLFHPDPPLLPLRTSDLDTEFYHTDMKVLADHFHGQLTVLYCVPTNPGPRSFHAWALRRCHWPDPQPIVQLLKPYSNLGPPIFRPPKVHEPVPNISRSRIFRPQRVYL